MTRINLVNPSLLSDAHLGAEYRELPRVFGLVRRAIERGELPNDPRNPKKYILGKGHVRFFYPRLKFLVRRYILLCHECRKRGRQVSYGNPTDLIQGISEEWMGDYHPSDNAIELNVSRIMERGGLRVSSGKN